MTFRQSTILFFVFCFATTHQAQTLKSDYLRYVKQAAEQGWQDYPRAVADWKKQTKPSELWGYDGPGQPIYLADLLAFLYQETKDKTYAEKTRDILAAYGDLREVYKDYQAKRVEYRQGIPAISNFFIMPPYARAYLRIRESGVLDAAAREKIERDLAFSLDHIFYFPEWGAHNRAMLRAESLYYGSIALAHHAHARRWKQLAETLASDSIRQWEIEDASGYQAVWLYSLFSYAEVSNKQDIYQSTPVKYYLDYFVQLLSPHGNIADFGDSHWNGGWERFVPVFEKAATVFRNPQYKFVAQELTRRAVGRMAQNAANKSAVPYVGAGAGSILADAFRWADDSVAPQKPSTLSQEVLEDVVGKKIVFRDGWEPTSTFMLLNYRDEGDGGWLGREYLRQNLSVEEEKAHHGHSDENSISLLMSGGSVLLHDGGYRPDIPSGEWGAWRADYFHNRVVARRNKRDKNQNVFEFIRNSGAYRQVRTKKIDFLQFKDAETSRTRLTDDDLGYQWDRVVTYLKSKEMFVIVDGIKALKSDYFTFTNLWHTRKIITADQRSFDTAIDKIGSDALPANKALLVHFPENAGKQTGTYQEQRHFQDETAIYQTISSFYNAGDMEFFVTVLLPHDRAVDARDRLRQISLTDTNQVGQSVGLNVKNGEETTALCIKLDLEMDLTRENIRPRHQYQLGKVKYGDFETDAAFLIATIARGEVRYAASAMTKILYRNQPLMEALPNTFGLQPDGAPPRTGYSRWRYWEDTVKVGN